eukprot:Gb_16652 [translate_table: standard]
MAMAGVSSTVHCPVASSPGLLRHRNCAVARAVPQCIHASPRALNRRLQRLATKFCRQGSLKSTCQSRRMTRIKCTNRCRVEMSVIGPHSGQMLFCVLAASAAFAQVSFLDFIEIQFNVYPPFTAVCGNDGNLIEEGTNWPCRAVAYYQAIKLLGHTMALKQLDTGIKFDR